MKRDPGLILKKLATAQSQLRQELMQELASNEDYLDGLFDQFSYNVALEELRDKYVTRLFIIQSLIHELTNLSLGKQKRRTRVISLTGADVEELTAEVNRKLQALDGRRVLDVKFSQSEDATWQAFIVYLSHPRQDSGGASGRWA